MYYVIKKLEVAGAHKLNLDYISKCSELHGHNWIVTVYCKSKELDKNGMVVDFSVIKKKIQQKLDHKFLNDVVDFNPTAENIAKWVTEQIQQCYKCSVQESNGNVAIYEQD